MFKINPFKCDFKFGYFIFWSAVLVSIGTGIADYLESQKQNS